MLRRLTVPAPSPPARPDGDAILVAELENMVVLFDFGGNDGRLAIKHDARTVDFYLILRLNRDVLILNKPSGAEMHRNRLLFGLQFKMHTVAHTVGRSDVSDGDDLPADGFNGLWIVEP